MCPFSVRRSDPVPAPKPVRFIYVGRFRIPIPNEDAPARQLLDFAALSAFGREGHPDAFKDPVLQDAANAAASAYLELYPEAVDEANNAD